MNIMVGNMGTYNRKNQLKEIHKQRRQDTEDKVRSAINKLLENNISINFNSVSNESGVTKATLYKNQNLKEMIIDFRDKNTDISLLETNFKNNSLSSKNIISLLLDIENLELENKKLKQQIDLLYSYIYEIL